MDVSWWGWTEYTWTRRRTRSRGVARYILYHDRPGCPNPFVGLAFNYALHLHYQSVFSHLLCRALAPAAAIAWAIFTRHFACITAVPRRYHDLVGEWAQSSGQTSDFPDPRSMISLTQMDWKSHDAHDMTVEDVTQILISNQIPVSWIDHAYTYGLHFLNHHMDGSATARNLYEAVDELRVVNLSVWGVPSAIAEWDGWCVLTIEDIKRTRYIMMGEERRGVYCTDNSYDWIQVGEDPHMERLRTRHGLSNPHVRRSPSPPVAGPSNHATALPDDPMAGIDGGRPAEEDEGHGV
jgi:hypothetical protein